MNVASECLFALCNLPNSMLSSLWDRQSVQYFCSSFLTVLSVMKVLLTKLDPLMCPSVLTGSSGSDFSNSLLQPSVVPSHMMMLGSAPHLGHWNRSSDGTNRSLAKPFQASRSLPAEMGLVPLSTEWLCWHDLLIKNKSTPLFIHLSTQKIQVNKNLLKLEPKQADKKLVNLPVLLEQWD